MLRRSSCSSLCVASFLILFSVSLSIAGTPQINSGLSWLTSAQTSTGNWPEVDTAEYYSTAASLDAVYDLEPSSPAYTTAFQWMTGQIVSPTDYLSRRIIALKRAGMDVSSEVEALLLYRNSNGGWGGETSYLSDNLDTALALQALKAANYSDTTLIGQSLNYLTTKQNADGGWGLSANDASNTYITAIVSATLQQFTQTTTIATAINKATTYLLAHQNTDGGFGNSPSHVYETALAYMALANVITDATVLGNAVNYLTTTQAVDGSWNEDPYSTALALQALHLSEARPTAPPPTTTTATVSGTVVDASTNQPLSGVSVQGAGSGGQGSASTVTSNVGTFSLSIPQGSQQITFALSGYSTSTATVIATAGSLINIGSVTLSVNPTFGIIQGTVTNSSNGSSLSGVFITVTGASTWTATTGADGSYKITGITPGSVTISAGKSGYTTVTGQTIVTAGETLVFSPSLAVAPTTGGLTGKVLDFATGSALSGATIVVTGARNYSTISDSSGSFAFSAADSGGYSVTVSFTGYGTQSSTITINANTTTNLGSISLVKNATTGTVSGMVTDAATGLPISGVAVTVSGDGTGSAITSADGAYQLSGINPGTLTITASKTGYTALTGTGTLFAGGTLVYSPALFTVPAAASDLKGSITDNQTNQVVSNAIVTATLSSGSTATVTTDANGAFTLHSLEPGTYTIAVTAAGYVSQTSILTIVSGVTTNLGTISLSPSPMSTTITGTVTDAVSGAVLSNVAMTIIGTTLATKTDSNGSYTITGITTLSFTVKASLTGYDSFNAATSTAGYGHYTGNISLSQSKVSTLRILTVQTDNASYSANADIVVTGTVENFGDTAVDTLISAEISDSAGNIIAIASPTNPMVNIISHDTTTVVLTWNTSQTGAGDYTITLKAKDTATVAYGTPPAVLAESPTGLTITAYPAIAGALSLSPPVTQANMLTPVAMTTAIRNTGNVHLSTTMRLEIARAGTVIYSQELPAADLSVNTVQELDFGSYTPLDGGNYTVSLKPVDPSIVSNITTTLYVGPYATGTFSATPAAVPPGNATISGKISLTGIGASSGVVQDPLVPLIKDAIQKGVNWSQTNAVSWQNTNRCYGCHVHTQTLIGMELSRGKVMVDDEAEETLLSWMKNAQAPSGQELYSPTGPAYWPLEATTLFAWSLSYYHDTAQTQQAITKAMDFILPYQKTAGYWAPDYCYGNSDLWNDLGCYQPSTPFTAYNIISLSKAYQLTGLQKYKDALQKAAGYLQNLDHTKSIVTAAHIAIGLHSAMSYIDEPSIQTAINTKIATVLAYVKSKQNADGGWGRYAGNASDPLPTAHVLYALSLITNMQNDAAILRNATTYLLNKQNADGTWTTTYKQGTAIPDQYFGATTWAIISLPAALETIAGVDAELTVSLSSTVSASNFSLKPTTTNVSEAGTTYTWNFSGLLQQATDVLMDLSFTGLQIGEKRSVAQDARLSFTDIYTRKTMTLPIDIPAVSVLDPAFMPIDVTTDRAQYAANQDVQITTGIMSNSSLAKSIAVRLTIEDQTGTLISEVPTSGANQLDPNYFPGWNYRIPVPVTAVRNMINTVAGVSVDFAYELQSLGLSNMTVDKNSIRVLERNAAGSVIGEKQAQAVFTSDTNALITWVLDGTTIQGTTRYFLLYFDTTYNGTKHASLNTKFPMAGKLIAYSGTLGNIFVVESNGDGTFGAARLVDDVSSSAADNTWGVAVDDFNNDGFADIVTGSGANGEIYYYQNKADGTNTFNAKVKIGSITSSGYIMSIASGDFNHDGNKDFVVSGNNTSLYLFLGKGDGSFKQSTLPSPSGETYLRAKLALDVDHDGKLDLLVTANSSGGLYLYKGNGEGTFQASVLLNNLGRDPYGLAVRDFNEDGLVDVLRSSDYAGVTYLYKGKGDGTFGAGTLISSLNPGTTSAYAAGDFNNDGHVDVIAANDKTIEFYPGNGDGTFGQKTIIAMAPGTGLGVSASPAMPVVFPSLGVPETVPPQTFSFTWNTGQTYAGLYQVHAVLSDQTGTLSEARASFAILPDIAATAKVVTDKAAYNPNETATMTATIASNSANYIMEKLSARVAVRSEAGGVSVEIFTETKPISTLMPGASFTFKSYWNAGTYAPGAYPVTLEVKDASGALVTTGTATVTITNIIKPSVVLKGTIAMDKQSLLSGETATVSYNVTNNGNIDLQNVDFSVLIVHVVNQTVYDMLMSQATLSMGATYAHTAVVDTTTYSAKDYLVILRANINGIEETLAGTYFRVEGAPTVPALISPAMGSDVDTFTPALTVSNASDPNDDKLTYEFEVYSDSGMTELITSSGTSSQGSGVTSWQVPVTLTENATYYWCARAYDNWLYGPWMSPASFRVNTVNDPPTAPVISSPANSGQVSTLTPVLVVTNATDPDSPSLTYNFELALDPGFTQLAASTTGIFPGQGTTSWQAPLSLTENTWYFWRCRADDWFTTGPWSTTAGFFVSATNEPPTMPQIVSPVNNATVSSLGADIVLSNSTDPDSPVISYYFELDTVPTFDGPGIMRSGMVAQGQGTTTWHVDGLTEDTFYFVRAKASDGQADSAWSPGTGFFVNAVNEPPTAPTLANPSNGSGVTVFTPTLSVYNATDPDKDALTYDFEVYSDAALTTLVTATTGITQSSQASSWTVPVTLTENQTYSWRCRAFDGTLYSAWMPQASFMVNTVDDAPSAPTLSSPADGSSVPTLAPTLAIVNATDPDSPQLTYDFEIYSGGTLTAQVTGVPEDGSGITSITLNRALPDNAAYQWRARAFDGSLYGPWTAMANFMVHVPKTGITATIDFDPDTLNTSSNGTWVVVYIELPTGYKPVDIDVSSIRLEGTIPAESWPYAIGDHDKDGIADLMVKFKRSDVIKLLPDGDRVTVHVTGNVGTTTFEGVDFIRVIH